ncbi:phosphoglycerate kinase-like isoform X3 [Phoenix dactylifera]|uniref:Phosphoglycerate kinase n=1 Tax=Phoenix dactylifera TaxID=42345 RepID=A0A8B7CZB6_PHODC|nr:phosphoglycerate kinase-like isoform X3 [Phoenix dactylifera]
MLHTSSFLYQLHCRFGSLTLPPHSSCMSYNTTAGSWSCKQLQSRLGSLRSCRSEFRVMCRQVLDSIKTCHVQEVDKNGDSGESNLFLHVQTLRNFPIEKIYGEVVIVRFDSTLVLEALDSNNFSLDKSLFTIKYLFNAGAKVLLVSNWGRPHDPMLLSVESLADRLSSLLQVKVVPANDGSGLMQSKMNKWENVDILLLDNLTMFREEVANCSKFSEKLSSGATIFVNDAFSLSHKILASTVGVTRFCHASVAGFNFEEELLQLKNISKTTRQPYVAIIGGSNFLEKANALHLLASKCDGLYFFGKLAFQVMNALGLSVPGCFVEQDAVGEALKLIQHAHCRKIPIYFPNDFWCINNSKQDPLEIFPSGSILTGWTPIDLGPVSLKELSSLLSICKKILLIGSIKFDSVKDTVGASKLALMLQGISMTGCDVTVVGNAACKAVAGTSCSVSQYKMFNNASVVWEFLKGRILPGVAALDRAYPHDLDWNIAFTDPSQPLIIDIGSGNGLFLLKMARRCQNYNFLGLEINKKLVRHCLNNVVQSNIKNGEEHRWRMVQRTLIEAIIDLLITNGKFMTLQVFLQSDIEAVATRMKEQFIMYAKGRLLVDGDENMGWLEENPFGIRSDWEQHVIDRGAPMFRIMLRKVR